MLKRLLPVLLAACTSSDPTDTTPCTTDVFADLDGDGFGDAATAAQRCPLPGEVDIAGDCDDANPAVFPGAPLVCADTSTDDDCDGVVDLQDTDGDADGATPCAGDCDDATNLVSPTAPELCNSIDDDCDGLVDVADDNLVNGIACGQCPDPADLGVPPISFQTLNPCVLDATTVSLCHRDIPDFVNTHEEGERLHRIIYRTDQPLRDELLLYLPPGPGTNNDQLLLWMAHTGHRMVSLGWTNENSAFVPDDTFFEGVRGELAYGDDLSPYVDVGPVDSIVGRLTTLLDYLAATEPTQGWEAYRDPTQSGAAGIRWDKIVVTGWSEGGSQAGWLARNHLFAGVVFISAPTDVGGQVAGADKLPPPPWVYDPRTTPECRHFEFYHQDEIEPDPADDVILLSLDAMGILPFGQLGVDVDQSVPPYGDARVINTAKTDFRASFCSSHQAMAMDQCMNDDLAIPYNWLYCTAGTPTAECP